MKLRRGSHLWLCIFSLWVSLPAQAQKNITFENVPTDDVAAIQKQFPSLNRSEWGIAELDLVVQELILSGRYDELKIIDNGSSKYMVRALATRLVGEVQIRGNHVVSRSEISDILGIQPGQRFDRKTLVAGAERLKDKYGGLGFYNATIEINFETPQPQQIIIKVDISENEPCRMFEIIVDTPNKIVQEALNRRVVRFKGMPLTEERIRDIQTKARDYFKENRFLNSQISEPQVIYNDEKTQARVIFKIDQPVRYDLVFSGNRKLTGAAILRGLNLETFPPGSANPPMEIALKIADIYRERGYANAVVTFSEKPSKKIFQKHIVFQIQEGYPVKIRSIQVGGNYSREQEYYERFVRSNSSDIISSGFYNKQGIELGAKNLQVELQNQGYLKAKVISVRTDFEEDKRHATVVINLDEGPLTKIKSISLKGVETIPEKDILEALELSSGSALQLSQLEQGIERIKNFYLSKGYMEMSILNEKQDLITYSEDNSEAEISIQIYEGPQVRVASIILEGNKVTKDYVVYREINLKEGDILTPELVNENTTRLLRLGIFSTVKLSTVEAGTSIANRTVLISLSEANPGLFNAGAGVTDEAQLTARSFAGIGYNNINGTARAVSGRADVSYALDPRVQFPNNQITLGYLEPFLFGTKTRGRVSLVRTERWFEFGEMGDGTPTLTIQQSSDGKVLLERDLSLRTKFTWQLYGFEVLRLYEIDGLRPENNTFNIASVGPTIDVDYRDNPFNPTKGSFTRWSTEYARPELGGSDTVYFVRSDAQYSHYLRINSPRWVWANQVRGGYLANLSDRKDSGVPSVRGFFLGGRTTVRGFEPSFDFGERFPSNRQLNADTIADFLIRGNSSYYLIKTELRFPIWGDFGGAVFYDGGSVTVSGYRFEDPYRDSVGFGFRYSTPVGPVNLEVGYKLPRKYVQQQRQSPYRIHFSIGTF